LKIYILQTCPYFEVNSFESGKKYYMFVSANRKSDNFATWARLALATLVIECDIYDFSRLISLQKCLCIIFLLIQS